MSEPLRTAFQAAKRFMAAYHWWGEGKATDGVLASTVSRAIVDPSGAIVASSTAAGKFNIGGGSAISKIQHGVASIASGNATVLNTSITNNSRIFLTPQDAITTGALQVSARTVGVSFVITSSELSDDAGVVAWMIVEP